MTDQTDGKKVTVVFSQDQLDDLRKLADATGLSLGDALGRAIEVGSLVMKAKSNRTQVIFKRGADLQELTLAS